MFMMFLDDGNLEMTMLYGSTMPHAHGDAEVAIRIRPWPFTPWLNAQMDGRDGGHQDQAMTMFMMFLKLR